MKGFDTYFPTLRDDFGEAWTYACRLDLRGKTEYCISVVALGDMKEAGDGELQQDVFVSILDLSILVNYMVNSIPFLMSGLMEFSRKPFKMRLWIQVRIANGLFLMH